MILLPTGQPWELEEGMGMEPSLPASFILHLRSRGDPWLPLHRLTAHRAWFIYSTRPSLPEQGNP